MGLREYARHRGVTLKTVQRAIEYGRIKTVPDKKGKKKIDSQKADLEWDANTNAAMIPAAHAERAAAIARGRKNIDEDPDGADPPGDDDEPDGMSEDEKGYNFFKARARKEEFAARLKEAEYRKVAGALVSIEEVNKELFNIARVVRDSILSLPAKISHKLASETDPHAVSILLETELRKALQEISDEGLSKRRTDGV